MLIDEDRVSIGVHGEEAGRPRCALVRLLLQRHPLCLQLALQVADVGERGKLLGVAVPPGVEGENVLLEHPLKKPDRVIAVLQDQPVLRCIPGEDLETELLVEPPRSLEILDSQADRERAEFHALPLSVRKRLPPNVGWLDGVTCRQRVRFARGHRFSQRPFSQCRLRRSTEFYQWELLRSSARHAVGMMILRESYPPHWSYRHGRPPGSLSIAAQGVRVRALARNPHTAGLPPRVDVVRGDLTLAETLDECLDGIAAVFLVCTAPPAAVAPALERIAKRVRRIVFLSAPLKTAHPFFQQPNPARALGAQIERLIGTSGLEWTFLRPGISAANALSWWAPQIRAGGDVVRWPHAAAPAAPIHERDIAAVAVRALCEDGHAGAEYVLTGPQSLSQFERLSTIGGVIGRPLRREEISPEDARNELLALMPAAVVNMLLDAWAAAVGQPAFVTSTVAKITGPPARTFRDWATDHAAEFRA